MKALHLLLAVTTGLLAGCATSPEFSPSDVSGPRAWGEDDGVMKLRHLYFSAQPGPKELADAAEAGVELVINLREEGELSGNEASQAKDAGLAFYNVPIKRKSALEPEALEEIEQILKANRGKKTLLHCRSGSRAGLFLATHLVSQHGVGVEDAIEIGEKAGMTVGQQKVRDYFSND